MDGVRQMVVVVLAFGLVLVGCQRTSPDGVLDCSTPMTFVEQPGRAEGDPGRPEREAVDLAVRRHAMPSAVEVVQVDDQTFSGVVDGSETLVISLERLDSGNVFVSQIRGCG